MFSLPQGHFLSLACHRNGSRVLDAVWVSASGPARAAIADELGECHGAWRGGMGRTDGWTNDSAGGDPHPRGGGLSELCPDAALSPLLPAASQYEVLQRDPHGRGVARTLALDLFRRRRQLWERLQAAPGRRNLLGPLLED